MDVNVSKAVETRIREIAKRSGQDIADLAGSLLEDAVNRVPAKRSAKGKTLSDLTGMFYGGPGDTAERASEILRAEMGLSSLGRD